MTRKVALRKWGTIAEIVARCRIRFCLYGNFTAINHASSQIVSMAKIYKHFRRHHPNIPVPNISLIYASLNGMLPARTGPDIPEGSQPARFTSRGVRLPLSPGRTAIPTEHFHSLGRIR